MGPQATSTDRRYSPPRRAAGGCGAPAPWILRQDERLPLLPGEQVETRSVRFRTMGDWPLTGATESTAGTIEALIAELRAERTSERQGRLIDHDEPSSMERKKREGYF